MKFFNSPKIINGKRYEIDFKDPYLSGYKFRGIVEVICSTLEKDYGDSHYCGINWFRVKVKSGLLNGWKIPYVNYTFFANRKSFKRMID